MKVSLFCISVILSSLLFSCSQPESNKKNGTATANNMSDMSNNDKNERDKMIANNELVNRAIESGNFNGIDTLWADDIVEHSGPMGKEVRGKDSIKAELMTMHKSMKDIKIETKTAAFDPEKGYLFTLSHLTATTTVPMEGMPANTKLDMDGVDLIKIKNGKATDHWSFSSPEEMMKMMKGQKSGKK